MVFLRILKERKQQMAPFPEGADLCKINVFHRFYTLSQVWIRLYYKQKKSLNTTDRKNTRFCPRLFNMYRFYYVITWRHGVDSLGGLPKWWKLLGQIHNCSRGSGGPGEYFRFISPKNVASERRYRSKIGMFSIRRHANLLDLDLHVDLQREKNHVTWSPVLTKGGVIYLVHCHDQSGTTAPC